jgi:hypothetical protein
MENSSPGNAVQEPRGSVAVANEMYLHCRHVYTSRNSTTFNGAIILPARGQHSLSLTFFFQYLTDVKTMVCETEVVRGALLKICL